MIQLQDLLSEKEYLVITALQRGMKPKEIAEKYNLTRAAVDQARYRGKLKLGDKLFREILVPVSEPQDKCVQNSTDLEEILSQLELRVFLSLKRSKKTWDLVAEETGTTSECARKIAARIKEKLGEDFERLVSHAVPIEGIVTIQEPKKESEASRCENCRHFYYSIIGKEGKKTFCSKHTKGILLHEEKRCSAYEEYIRVDDNCDMKKINEALEDKGLISMAYKIGTGYEPTNSVEKTQFAIAGLGYRGFHFRRRRQARRKMEMAARHTIVVLTDEDRSRPEVKQKLKELKLTPVKLDFDEEGKTAYYALKDNWSYKQLMSTLVGSPDFIISDTGTITILLEYDAKIEHLGIRKNNSDQLQLIVLDEPSKISKSHTARSSFSQGTYIISIKLEVGLIYEYEVKIRKREGKIEVKEVKPLI